MGLYRDLTSNLRVALYAASHNHRITSISNDTELTPQDSPDRPEAGLGSHPREPLRAVQPIPSRTGSGTEPIGYSPGVVAQHRPGLWGGGLGQEGQERCLVDPRLPSRAPGLKSPHETDARRLASSMLRPRPRPAAAPSRTSSTASAPKHGLSAMTPPRRSAFLQGARIDDAVLRADREQGHFQRDFPGFLAPADQPEPARQRRLACPPIRPHLRRHRSPLGRRSRCSAGLLGVRDAISARSGRFQHPRRAADTRP